jgi:hypothetical protein
MFPHPGFKLQATRDVADKTSGVRQLRMVDHCGASADGCFQGRLLWLIF